MPGRFRWYSPLLIVALLTCGKDATAPDEPGLPSPFAGLWSYSENLENVGEQITCHNEGTVVISQDGADLSGTVTQVGGCTIGGDFVDNSGTASFSGNVGAATVRFRFAGCNYQGDLFNTPRDSAGGEVDCSVTIPLHGRVTLSGTWWAIQGTETGPPQVSGTIVTPPNDIMFVTGETFRLTISASDDRKLHSVGYRIGPPMNVQDSITTTDTTFADTTEFVVPASWEGQADVMVWARDAAGSATFQNIGTLRVLNGIRRPFQTLALGVRAADAAFDSARNTMYFFQPESARVAVLALSSFTLGASIPVPMAPAGYVSLGIDLVPGGDTVVLALPDTARLGLLDRLANTVTTSRITTANGTTLMRVTANRHVFVYGSRDSSGFTFFGVWDRDLATGVDTLRRDIGSFSGHLGAITSMFRSPDQKKLLVISGCAYLYDVTSDSFSSCGATGFGGFELATATTTGDKWLIGDKLLDSSLALLATVPGLTAEGHAGMSPDGTAAYRPASYGYDKIALPSGTLLERVRIPVPVTGVTVFPQNDRLFLWSDTFTSTLGLGTTRATVVTLP